MTKFLQSVHPIVFLLIATTLEVTGDAIIRKSIYTHTGLARIAFAVMGMILLFGYGLFLNLAPVEFGKVVGLYIATLFVVWQVISYIAFNSVPSLPIIIGGTLVIAGGLIITFWKPK
jgi:small multidrug resistance family-3 protein